VVETICNPVLLFGGEAGHYPIESMDWIRSAIPGAEPDVVPAAKSGSHFWFYENARRFNERLVGWLRE